MKTQILKIMIGAGITAGLAAAGIAADEAEGKKKKAGAGGGDRGAIFDRLDTNGDGKITEAEAPEQAWARLKQLDKDGDGAIAKSELPQRPAGGPGAGGAGGKMAQFLKQMDADGDGKITESEAGERWGRLGQLDKNGDGAVDLKTELPQAPAGGAGGAGRGEFFAKADKNGDEKLTADEVPEQAWERLSKLDKNGDNAIDKDELAAIADAIKAKAGQKPGGGRPGGDNGGKKPKRPEIDES